MISDECLTLFLSSSPPSGSVLDEDDSNYPQLASSPQSMDSVLTTGDGEHLATALETFKETTATFSFLLKKKTLRRTILSEETMGNICSGLLHFTILFLT